MLIVDKVALMDVSDGNLVLLPKRRAAREREIERERERERERVFMCVREKGKSNICR